MMLDDIAFVLENSINPFVVFDSKGKMTFLNKNASMFSNIDMAKKLYILASQYAPKNFGYKTSYIDLCYANKSFYAIMVAYQNEDNLCLLLYQKHIEYKLDNNSGTMSDINLLLDSSIEYFTLTNDDLEIKLFTDYDIPPVHLEQNSFLILVRKLLQAYAKSSYIDIVLKIKLGEIVEIGGNKCHIIQLIIDSDKRDDFISKDIINSTNVSNMLIFFDENKSILEIIGHIKLE